jgi:hypothetical protein
MTKAHGTNTRVKSEGFVGRNDSFTRIETKSFVGEVEIASTVPSETRRGIEHNPDWTPWRRRFQKFWPFVVGVHILSVRR